MARSALQPTTDAIATSRKGRVHLGERTQLLALAQYRAGRQGEALRTISGVRRRLVDELGIDPGPGLGELEQAILRQDPDLDTAEVRQRPDEACPYLGLMPYDVDGEATTPSSSPRNSVRGPSATGIPTAGSTPAGGGTAP